MNPDDKNLEGRLDRGKDFKAPPDAPIQRAPGIDKPFLGKAKQSEADLAELSAVRDTLAKSERSEVAAGQEILSESESKDISAQLYKLKEIILSGRLSEKVKNFLLGAEIASTIMGIKPASYIQPTTEKRTMGLITRKGLSNKELGQLQAALHSLGVDTKSVEGFEEDKKREGCELIHLWRTDKVLDVMGKSEAFSAAEIEEAKSNVGKFIENRLSSRFVPYSKAVRVGILYGYPISDVKKFTRLKEIKEQLGITHENASPEKLAQLSMEDRKIVEAEQKSVSVKGVNNSVDWQTLDPESPETQMTIKRIQAGAELERKILGV